MNNSSQPEYMDLLTHQQPYDHSNRMLLIFAIFAVIALAVFLIKKAGKNK